MSETENFYSLLGVTKEANEQEIKIAFRTKAKEIHPDRSSESDSSEKTKLFQKIREAYDVISDPQRRKEYDRTLNLKPHVISAETLQSESVQKLFSNDSSFFTSNSQIFNQAKRDRSESNSGVYEQPQAKRRCIDNLESTQLPPLKNISQSKSMPILNNTPQGSPSPMEPNSNEIRNFETRTAFNFTSIESLSKMYGVSDVTDVGETLYSTLEISFNESVLGCEKAVVFKRKEICTNCDTQRSSNCNNCNGTRLNIVNASLIVNIPAGVIDGCKKRLPQQGNSSVSGRKGDLIVTVKVGAHPFIRRRNQIDVECDLPISYPHAALGVTLNIPSIRGQVKVCYFF